MGETYVLRNGELVPKHLAPMDPVESRPYVISDAMEPLHHPITGQVMDSKAAFRRVTRQHGCEEVGNDKWPDRRPVEPPNPRAVMKEIVERVTPMSRSEMNNFMADLARKAQE